MDVPVFSVPWKQTPQELSFVMLRDVGLLLPPPWQGMEWEGWLWDGSGVRSPALGWLRAIRTIRTTGPDRLRTSWHSLPEVPPASKGLCLSPLGAEQLSQWDLPEGRFPFFTPVFHPQCWKVRQV